MAATVLPGLTDPHRHIFGIGQRDTNTQPRGDDHAKESFLAKVKEAAGERAPAAAG